MVLIALLLVSNSEAIAQTGYPKILVTNSDTLALITLQQVTEMNLVYIDLEECTTINDTLSDLIAFDTQVIQELKNERTVSDKALTESIQVNTKQGEVEAELREYYEKALKKEQNKTKKVGALGFVGIIITAILQFIILT